MIGMKKVLLTFAVLFYLHISIGAISVAAQSEPVGLVINGQAIHNLPAPPIIDQDRVLVPARAVFENLGATVYWQEDARVVHVQYHTQNVRLVIGESSIVVNNYPIEIPVPAQIINDHTMIPVRAVSTNLGFNVDFRDRTVFVDNDYMRPPIIIDDFITVLDTPSGPVLADEDAIVDAGDTQQEETAPPSNIPVATLPGNLLNVSYSHADNILFIPRTATPLMNAVTHTNLYHENRYRLSLNVDASQLLATGAIASNTSLLDSIDVIHGSNGTELVFNGRQMLALHVGQNDSYYTIHVMCPRQRYRRIVIIDPGHGGERPGAVYDDIRAADLNLAITRKLLTLIEADGHIRAFTTRNSDATVYWSDRYEMGNSMGDLMITIHHNAAYNLEVHGIEAFYVTDEHDNGRALTNQRFAQIVQDNLVAQTGRHDRGIRSEDFTVLLHTNIPSALVEVGFMSNQAEFATLTDPQHQWRTARGIYHALLEAFADIPSRW